MSALQTLSVIVPCRNEVDHIDAFCRCVVAQNVPEGWVLEALIADGLSDDGTRERLAAWCQQDTRFVMLDNPGRIVSSGLNACIAKASGAFLVRLDVHTVYAPDYIAQCLATWQATRADNVGGPWKAQGLPGTQATVQRAIAVAFQSRWVAGGALSRDLAYEGEVDTVYLGAWPRATFERFGGFDEKLVRNQDDEHNLRIHKGGGRIWQSARIQSTYVPRASKADVFRQYRQYGYWKPFVMSKHGQAAAWRHLVPGAFVATLLLLLVLTMAGCAYLSVVSLAWPDVLDTMANQIIANATLLSGLALGALAVLYGVAVWSVSLAIARKQGLDLLRHLPDVIGAYHLGYGLGSLQGWWDALVRHQPNPVFGHLTRGSTPTASAPSPAGTPH